MLVVLVAVAGAALAVAWWQQRRLIYFPDTTPPPPAAQVLAGGRDVTLHTADGLDLAAWFVPGTADDGTTGRAMAVLVAPGNGGNRAGRAGLADELRRRGFSVLLMDYRGYGGNPGTPSERGLAQDAMAAVEELERLGFPSHRQIHVGESLGTAVVAALQSRRPPAGIVLRSPFTNLADVGAHNYPWLPVRTLLTDHYEVIDHLATTRVPVIVLYGTDDSVVPPALSAEVADRCPSLVERVVLDGADHNDPVMFGPLLADAVARLAAQVD